MMSCGKPNYQATVAFCYGIVKSAKLLYCRVSYDIASVQDRMKAVHLPERHIQRLAAGW
jgi:hypothetical protein